MPWWGLNANTGSPTRSDTSKTSPYAKQQQKQQQQPTLLDETPPTKTMKTSQSTSHSSSRTVSRTGSHKELRNTPKQRRLLDSDPAPAAPFAVEQAAETFPTSAQGTRYSVPVPPAHSRSQETVTGGFYPLTARDRREEAKKLSTVLWGSDGDVRPKTKRGVDGEVVLSPTNRPREEQALAGSLRGSSVRDMDVEAPAASVEKPAPIPAPLGFSTLNPEAIERPMNGEAKTAVLGVSPRKAGMSGSSIFEASQVAMSFRTDGALPDASQRLPVPNVSLAASANVAAPTESISASFFPERDAAEGGSEPEGQWEEISPEAIPLEEQAEPDAAALLNTWSGDRCKAVLQAALEAGHIGMGFLVHFDQGISACDDDE